MLDLDAIRERCEKATEGPWVVCDDYSIAAEACNPPTDDVNEWGWVAEVLYGENGDASCCGEAA